MDAMENNKHGYVEGILPFQCALNRIGRLELAQEFICTQMKYKLLSACFAKN